MTEPINVKIPGVNLMVGFRGKMMNCRCRFREGEPCKFKCDKRVESCEACGLGGGKMPAAPRKKRR